MLYKSTLKKLFKFSPAHDLPDKIKALEQEILDLMDRYISTKLTIDQIIFLWGKLKDPDFVRILYRKTTASLKEITSVRTMLRATLSTTNEELKIIFKKRANAIQRRKIVKKINPFK